MTRNKNLPLTETVYFILLALIEPAHGYVIMQKIEELSSGQVRLAAGTLYGAVENLLKKGFICAIPGDDPRRKVYGLTPLGKETLLADYQRMQYLTQLTKQRLEEWQ